MILNEKIFLFFLIGAAFPIFSEDLNREAVRNLALANSRSLARYNLSLESSLLSEKEQKFAYLPKLSLGADAGIDLWNQNGLVPIDSLKAGASFSVVETVTLYDGGKNKVLKAISAIATESVRKDALSEYYNVLDEADSAYYAVLEARANLDAQLASLQTADLSLATAQVRYENKMISYGDYLKALAEREAAETTRKQAEQTLSVNMAKLKNITGLTETPILADIDFTRYESLIQQCAGFDKAAVNAIGDKLWAIVRTNNPALAKAALSNESAEKNLDLAKRDYFPTLSASASTGLSYSYQYGSTGNGFSPFSGSLTLKASIPLEFWTTGNKVQKQELSLEQVKLSYLDSLASAAIETQTSLLSLVTQASSVLSAGKAYDYAKKYFEYVQELYQLSQKSLADLSDAVDLETRSHNQFTSARYGFLRALSKIRGLGAFADEEALFVLLTGTR
jgi:outer membrane protein TolC